MELACVQRQRVVRFHPQGSRVHDQILFSQIHWVRGEDKVGIGLRDTGTKRLGLRPGPIGHGQGFDPCPGQREGHGRGRPPCPSHVGAHSFRGDHCAAQPFDKTDPVQHGTDHPAIRLAPNAVDGADAGGLVDDTLDLASDALQGTLVVFESNDDVGLLGDLDLAEGFLSFDVLPVGYALLTGSQIETVASWDAVRYVEANRDLDYHNADAREVTGVSTVQNDLGYDGSSVHT